MEKISNLWRVVQLINILNSKPGLTANQLAEVCEISTRTVYRYLNILKMAGLPLYNNKGYHFTAEVSLPALQFTLVEAITAYLALATLSKHKNTPYGYAAKHTLEKINLLLPPQLKNLTIKTPYFISFGRPPKVNYAQHSRLFRQLEEARVNRKSCYLTYNSFERNQTTERVVDPLGLIYRIGFWYLIAFCHKRKEIRLFRIDRIKKVIQLEQAFQPPKNFNVEEYMKDAWHVVRGKPQKVQLKLTGKAAKLVSQTVWHQSQQVELNQDGSAIVTFYISSLGEIIPWIISLGSEAKVLSPPKLKKRLLSLISNVQKVYS